MTAGNQLFQTRFSKLSRYPWQSYRTHREIRGLLKFEMYRRKTKLLLARSLAQSHLPHQKSCSRKVRNTAVGSRNILELMTKVQSKIVRLTAGPAKKQSKKMQAVFFGNFFPTKNHVQEKFELHSSIFDCFLNLRRT